MLRSMLHELTLVEAESVIYRDHRLGRLFKSPILQVRIQSKGTDVCPICIVL